jgi:uncharacterized protein YprB with RNaseH-like and TPR domain
VDGFFYLDIETDRDACIGLVGILDGTTGTYHTYAYPPADELREWLMEVLPALGRLVTFNGRGARDYCATNGDLGKIFRFCGLDLEQWMDHIDLRWECKDHGLVGGQKAIEATVGFYREYLLEWGLIFWMFDQYRYGEWGSWALKKIKDYNQDDLLGLEFIHRHLLTLS